MIGDGAITAGMAFEAMNHAGDIKPDMLVILNDNEMSISENVGALNNHLAQLLSGKLYSTLREGGKKVFWRTANQRAAQAHRRTHQRHGRAGHTL